MVHSVPLPWDSTNRAMIVSTSNSSDPARINFRMLRTVSLEKEPHAFCARSTFGRSCSGDCVAEFITKTSGLERRLVQLETETAQFMAGMFRRKVGSAADIRKLK